MTYTTRSTPPADRKAGSLADAELNAFLCQGLLGRLAVLDNEGWPYVQPVWFTWDPDDEVFWVIARERSAWARFIVHDERVALTIDEAIPPYRKVSLQGQATVVEKPNVGGRWVEIAKGMATRYLGEQGPEYIAPTLDKPRWLFRVAPVKMTTWQGLAWASRYTE